MIDHVERVKNETEGKTKEDKEERVLKREGEEQDGKCGRESVDRWSGKETHRMTEEEIDRFLDQTLLTGYSLSGLRLCTVIS